MKFKVGDKVSDHGKIGVVIAIYDDDMYAVLVEFDNVRRAYTLDGFHSMHDDEPSLKLINESRVIPEGKYEISFHKPDGTIERRMATPAERKALDRLVFNRPKKTVTMYQAIIRDNYTGRFWMSETLYKHVGDAVKELDEVMGLGPAITFEVDDE